ncbi:MAG: ion transporter [Spirochaetales bacterium]|nr:ion transporter [Spirochaetales bacterium]
MTLAIILVLLQTIVEDLLVMGGAPWTIRRFFVFSGFLFDLFFTVEFLIRGWNALMKRNFSHYIFRENGWVDFVASVPLLIFTSGPEFFALLDGAAFAGAGVFVGLLKVVKAVRMARVLRLLRLLKIFKRIRFADSTMVQRHTVRIVTTATAALIFSATVVGMIFALAGGDGPEEAWRAHQEAQMMGMFGEKNTRTAEDMMDWAQHTPGVILLKDGEDVLFSPYEPIQLETMFGPSDFATERMGSLRIWFDLRPAAVGQSRLNLIVFLSSLAVVFALMLSYSPHFAITVSDPVNVMIRGMGERSYNLEVSIPEALAQDDVFRLAQLYNDEFLPLKGRSALEERGGQLDISLDDIGDLLKP